jgi:2-polyprenyl-3-methyl-5-hydroxy-6-metoxy-1,4-benzoquinol methylase
LVGKYLSPPAKVLDAGCGAGLASVDLVQRGFVVHGMDLAERMLDLCAQNFSRHGIDPAKYTLTLGNILDSKLPPNSYDGIIALGFLQYQTDEDGALAALSRLLRPGGILVLSGPVKVKLSNFFGLQEAIKRPFGVQKPKMTQSADPSIQLLLRISTHSYSLSRLRELLKHAGMSLIDYKGHGYVHFKIIGRWLIFERELFLHRTLTKLARIVPIERFANDIVVVARKPARAS